MFSSVLLALLYFSLLKSFVLIENVLLSLPAKDMLIKHRFTETLRGRPSLMPGQPHSSRCMESLLQVAQGSCLEKLRFSEIRYEKQI